MFGWIKDWIEDLINKLLYSISKAMYYIIDKMMACANMLVGIEPISYQGQETDFLTFLLKNPNITLAFTGAVIIALILVILFSVFMIARSVATEKVEKTPMQIFVQAGKTILTFIFIPAAMIILIWFTNVLMQVLYSTTLGGSPDGMGRFLAASFGQNALKPGYPDNYFIDPAYGFDYMSYSKMKDFYDMDNYEYLFSYISCIVIIISIGLTLLMFVDRAISLVILFVVSPLSISATVIDDGARFKLWRDQFLTKFLTGYGCIIGINIYILVVVALTDSQLVFFNDSTLNYIAKILIIIGGAVSMTKLMALIGNLIVAGAGSNEMRDTALAMAGMGRVFGAAAGVATSPFRAVRSAYNFTEDAKHRGLGTTIGQRMGFRTNRDYRMEEAQLNMGKLGQGAGAGNNRAGEGAKNMNNNNNHVGNIIGGGNPGGKPGGGNNPGGNKNDKAGGGGPAGSGMVNNAVNSALNGGGEGGRQRSNSVNLPRRK